MSRHVSLVQGKGSRVFDSSKSRTFCSNPAILCNFEQNFAATSFKNHGEFAFLEIMMF